MVFIAYWTRLPLLLLMLLSGRLVGLKLPAVVRHCADSSTPVPLAMTRILPQLFWNVLGPLSCVRMPFSLLMPCSVSEVALGMPSAFKHTALMVAFWPA